MDGSNNLEACQSACQEDENCSAINFYKTGGCTLRACPYPVPAPSWRLSDHVGYYKSSGSFAVVTHFFREMISNQRETCHTDDQIGTNTKEEGENRCRERCSTNAKCNYFFFTYDKNGWCVLYSACQKRRKPWLSGSTFKRVFH